MQNIYVEISFAILIFLIVLDQTLREGDGKWLQGRMHDSKCDPEEKVILKKRKFEVRLGQPWRADVCSIAPLLHSFV